jgi:hypothetical protein
MSVAGQKAKYSPRAHVVRFAPDNGLKSDIAGGPFRANRRHRGLELLSVFGLPPARMAMRATFVPSSEPGEAGLPLRLYPAQARHLSSVPL